MANVIKSLPTTSLGDPEILPWATGGTTLEPTTGQESTGWQPQAIAGPPDYRLENYARLKQSELNARGVQTAVFVECCQAQITLAGYNAGVNQRRITINAVNFDVTDGGGSVSAVRDAFVAAINSHAAISSLVTASAGGAGILYITDNAPGDTYSMAPSLVVSVLAGAGTITISSPGTTPIVREDAIGMASDLVIGSKQADDDGIASHQTRIVWRKNQRSFRAGKFTGTQANLSNTGIDSVGLGYNVIASGSSAVSIGASSTASGAYTVALGNGASATDDHGIAAGHNASNDAENSVALGTSATVGLASNFSAAIGPGSTVSAGITQAVALGYSATASGTGALAAVGGTASGTGAIALGGTASALAAVSLGSGTASGSSSLVNGTSTASGNYSVALGNSAEATANYAVAIGNNPTSSKLNSVALGVNTQANNTGEVCYSGTDLGAANGRSQWGVIHMWGECNGGSSIELKPDGQADSFFPDDKAFYLCEIKGVGIQTSSQANYATFEHTFGCYKAGGAVTIQFGTGAVTRTHNNYNLAMTVGAPGGQIVITGDATAVANPSRFAVQLRYTMITTP